MKIDSVSELRGDASVDNPEAGRTVATRRMVACLCSLLLLIASPLGSLSAGLPEGTGPQPGTLADGRR